MPDFILHWEIAGDVQLSRGLAHLALALDDFREPLEEFGDKVVYPETEHQFEDEGDPSWPALDPAYAARKERVAPGAGILHLTGALEASLTDKHDSGAVYRLEPLLLEIGSGVEVGDYNLALIHYKPESSPLPARKMMRLRPAAQTGGIMIFHRWLTRVGRERGVGL